ncbi:MAG: M15 family metallopeptidase [Eubacteriales bacterium]|nr:M15 family metallopeptidase [Eubacteriales bacterium]
MGKRILIGGAVAVLLVSGVLGWRHHLAEKDTKDTSEEHYEYYYNEEGKEQSEDGTVIIPEDQTKEDAPLIDVDTDPESITVLVNQEYLLPGEYIPADLVKPNIAFSFYGTYEKSYMRKIAADALEKLFAAAEKEGYLLKGVSAYRSYERQKQIYDRNVATRGKKQTDRVSAKPGSSEHQTGLTIDVSCSSIGCALEESFGETEEGKWLAKNCHKFGFIIRYPEDKSDITGYSYEPWHIRYVGKNLAKYLHKKNLTLEEYYQTTTVDHKVAPDERVQDTDEGAPEGAQVSSAPTVNPSYKPRKSPSPSPSKTKKPKASKKPEKTKSPKATPKKKATAKPKMTAKPTQVPKETPQVEKPKATVAPTNAPVETDAPQDTEQSGAE